jgi:hypothetical protein
MDATQTVEQRWYFEVWFELLFDAGRGLGSRATRLVMSTSTR